MNKVILLAVLLIAITAASFGTEINFGIGVGINYQGAYGMTFKWQETSPLGFVENSDFGAALFLDATYAELDIIGYYGYTRYTYENGARPIQDASGFALETALLGKYPFTLKSFTLFPLLGITYQFGFWAGGLGFLGGVGADFPLKDRIYLRTEFLFGIRLWGTNGKDHNFADSTPGLVPKVKVGVGYALK